ncbi:hypothetical protein EJB05_14923, partial [Eragrostis curvula]
MAAPPRRVVICGGGVVGACTAYYLSTHAAAPTVPTLFEKCAPACAASGKAAGFLALDWCDSDPALSALARTSFALHRRLAATLNGAEAYGFRPVHTLSICVPTVSKPSTSPPHPRLPAWVDPEASAERPRELGTPDSTAQVHPGLFTKAVLAASGAEVVIGEVERVVVRDGRVAGVAVKGQDGVVDADAVVLALGPWTGRLEVAKGLGVSGLKGHSVVLRPRQPEKITPHALFLTYQTEPGAETLAPDVFPRPNGEVYICGMIKYEDAPDDPATITGEPDVIAMLHKLAGVVSSHLKTEEGAEVIAEQACYRPCTTDGLPIVGEMPGVKGCYVATGHGRWGILNAPATGAALAELILDGKAKTADIAPFSPARFLNSSHHDSMMTKPELAVTVFTLSKNRAAYAPNHPATCAPACAASGKAGGFLALDWCDSTPALSALARASFALHHRLAASLDGAEAYGFRPVHTLSICVPTVSTPSTSPTHPLLPAWVNPSASAAPPRELGTPETTAQVHPGLFTKAVLAASGAEVVIGEVERVVVRDGRVAGVAVKGRDGVVDADAVVLALGPWTGRLEMVREVFDVSGLKAHSIVLRPREPEKITPHALFLSYQPAPGAKMLDPEVYPRPTGEVYICGMSKDEDAPDDPATITGEPDSIAMLHKIAGKVSSHLKTEEGAEVVAEQACYLLCSTDGLPIIGEMPGVKGCYVATGHSCWGILNGPATGAALAELILDGKAKTVDLAPFSPARFLERRSRR